MRKLILALFVVLAYLLPIQSASAGPGGCHIAGSGEPRITPVIEADGHVSGYFVNTWASIRCDEVRDGLKVLVMLVGTDDDGNTEVYDFSLVDVPNDDRVTGTNLIYMPCPPGEDCENIQWKTCVGGRVFEDGKIYKFPLQYWGRPVETQDEC